MDKNWLTKAIGGIVSSHRKSNGLTLSQLARLTNSSIRELMTLERGKADIDLVSLNEVCCVLGVTVGQLFETAYAADFERIVVATSLAVDPIELTKAYRDIVVISPASLSPSLFETHRTDALVIDESDIPLIELERLGERQLAKLAVVVIGCEGSQLPASSVILLPNAIDHLLAAVDRLLLSLPKGKVCNMRRLQDGLRIRQSELSDQQRLLAEKQTALGAKMQGLVARQKEIFKQIAHRTERQANEGIQARMQRYSVYLQKTQEKLALQQDQVMEQTQFERHRERFLRKQENFTTDAAQDF